MRRLERTIGTLTLVAAMAALLATPAAGAAKVSVADFTVGGDSITWAPRIADYERLVLTVGGPDGFLLRREFAAGESPRFGLFDQAGFPLADGFYKYELVAMPRVDETTRERMAAARAAGDDSLVAALRREGLLPAEISRQAGSFSIRGGAFVRSDLKEPGAGAPSPGTDGLVSAPGPEPDFVVLTNADGVIRNSLCVGFDCPNSPSFSDTTILLMENNTRIKFDDTSTLAGFPNNDWELQANSSSSGGGNFFAVNDCGNSSQGGCADDPMFKVESGARANALYVESDGDVGMGTSNPTVNIHTVDGNTPTLRLEQDGSSGFAPQTWDVAGNETNFFIRDATGGSQLPFRIQPGADSNALFIASDNDIGIGTSSPTTGASVDIRKSQPLLHFQDAETTTEGWAFGNSATGTQFLISKDGTGGTEVTLNERLDGSGSATVVVSGSVQATNVVFPSSRALKTDFAPLDATEILARLMEVPITAWRFKDGPPVRHIGPVAEDFQAAFASVADGKHISMMDANGITMAAVQGLNRLVQEKEREIAELKARLEALESALGLAP